MIQLDEKNTLTCHVENNNNNTMMTQFIIKK